MENMSLTPSTREGVGIYVMAVATRTKNFASSSYDDHKASFSGEKVPAHLLFLEWISSDRLVFVSSPQDRGPTIVRGEHQRLGARQHNASADVQRLELFGPGDGPPRPVPRCHVC